MAMLVGTFSHTLDAKYRMRIPAKLKKVLGDDFIFARGSNHCIYVFSSTEAEKLIAEMSQVNIFDLERQKSVRMFAAGFEEVTEDIQGRIVLSPGLRGHALIGKEDKELVIIGAVTHVEIWSKKVYEDYVKGMNFDEVIARLGNS